MITEEKSALEQAIESYKTLETFIEIESKLIDPFDRIKFYDKVLFDTLSDILENPEKKDVEEGLLGYIKSEKIKANQQAEELAVKEPLSGTLRKGEFEKRYFEEISRAERRAERSSSMKNRTSTRKVAGKKREFKDEPYLTLGIIDINNFKEGINDKYGHLFGDEVIAIVGEALREYTRDSDIVGRIGGDEFAIVLLDTSKKIASKVGKRLVENVNNYVTRKILRSHPEFEGKMTISLGLAIYDLHSKNAKQLLDFADKAMYHAKKEVKGVKFHVYSPSKKYLEKNRRERSLSIF